MRANIDEDTARRVLALNCAVAALNFAGPKLHQYRSAAVDFCASMEINNPTIVCAIEKCGGKERENLRELLWRDAKSVISAQ